MFKPLNPLLYSILTRLYGTVIPAREGEKLDYELVTDKENRQHLDIGIHGENYRICCPFCGDTTHRLYISYMYGKEIPGYGTPRYLCTCFNETACMSDPDNRRDLYERIATCGDLAQALIVPGKPAEPDKPATLPKGFQLLTELPADHFARLYLQRRFFDVDLLVRRYRVGYCGYSPDNYLASNRLIIPVFQDRKLCGWQARYCGKLPGDTKVPKYYSCFRKSHYLYNLDLARHYHTAVLVEGPTSAWGFGPMAVASFGCVLHQVQQRLLVSVFGKRTVCLLYDDDTYTGCNARRVAETIKSLQQQLPGKLAVLRLPSGYDAAELDTNFLRSYVTQQAREQGVEVNWERLPKKSSVYDRHQLQRRPL